MAGATAGSLRRISDTEARAKYPPAPRLSEADVQEYHERGYLLVRGLVPASMVQLLWGGYSEALLAGLEPRVLQAQFGKPGNGRSEGWKIRGWGDAGYLDRVMAVGRQLLEQTVLPDSATLLTSAMTADQQRSRLRQREAAGSVAWGCTSWLAFSECTAMRIDGMAAVNYGDGPVKWAPASMEYAAGDVSFHRGRGAIHYEEGQGYTNIDRGGLAANMWPTGHAGRPRTSGSSLRRPSSAPGAPGGPRRKPQRWTVRHNPNSRPPPQTLAPPPTQRKLTREEEFELRLAEDRRRRRAALREQERLERERFAKEEAARMAAAARIQAMERGRRTRRMLKAGVQANAAISYVAAEVALAPPDAVAPDAGADVPGPESAEQMAEREEAEAVLAEAAWAKEEEEARVAEENWAKEEAEAVAAEAELARRQEGANLAESDFTREQAEAVQVQHHHLITTYRVCSPQERSMVGAHSQRVYIRSSASVSLARG